MNTDLKTSELMLGKYDKENYQSCQYCHQVIEIKKGFKEDPSICSMCFKLLQNEDKTNPQIHVIWTENQEYSFYKLPSFLSGSYIQVWKYKDKYGGISQETIDIHLNSLT